MRIIRFSPFCESPAVGISSIFDPYGKFLFRRIEVKCQIFRFGIIVSLVFEILISQIIITYYQ